MQFSNEKMLDIVSLVGDTCCTKMKGKSFIMDNVLHICL